MERHNAVFRDCYSRTVMQAVMELHFPDAEIVADLTWGKGAFWSDEVLERWRVLGLDRKARYGAVAHADSRAVPLPDQSVDVAVFDPPHQHGRSKTTTLRHQADFDRMDNQAQIHQLIADTAPELRRISRQGAVIKLTDMIEAGRFMPTHGLVMAACSPILGWPEDVAILDSGVVRPVKPSRILHLRHAHSYFLIYKWAVRTPRSPLVYEDGVPAPCTCCQ